MNHTLPEFLAHAIAMERESAERYLELADMMETYNNTDVSALFREMNRYSIMHHDSVRERAGSIELPAIKSWQYRWTAPPEVTDDDAFNRELDAFTALQYAHENELRAAEEQEHAAALDRWIGRTPRPSVTFDRDPEANVLEKHR